MREAANFGERTFLERVSLAAREPVYSAAIAWALDEYSPLPLEERLAVIADLCGADTSCGNSVRATTEWNDIDLLLSIDTGGGYFHVAIENKIKASERDNQLTAYDSHLQALSGDVYKVYLSLSGAQPQFGDGWKPVPYSTLHRALSAQAGASNPAIADFCAALARLVTVAVEAQQNELIATVAFGEGPYIGSEPISSYIVEMRLKGAVQRIWMEELASLLGLPAPWQVSIGETRGQAHLNVGAELRDRPGYYVGLQLQRRTLKAFCAPAPYPQKATDQQHLHVAEVLEEIRSGFNLGEAAEPSAARLRGFRSYSVGILPDNRGTQDWVLQLQPRLDTLCKAFPVQVVAGFSSDITGDEDEAER